MKVKKLLCLSLAAAISCSGLPVQAANAQEATAIGQEGTTKPAADSQADADGFEIDEIGCLVKYTGEGGDVVIPENVTRIGNFAFQGCSSLTSISIPEGVASIGYCAFQGCSSLASISIPKGVASIGWSAFQDCSSLASASIPEGVTSIESETFSGCSSLTSISIPEGVASIGYSAFENCSNLASIFFPESVTSIGGGAFSGTKWLKENQLLIVNNILCDANSELCQGDITIPENVTSIGDDAFWGCYNLTGVSIPKSVTSLELAHFKTVPA